MNKFLNTEKEITDWLDQYAIQNYRIVPDEKYGLAVNVAGDVNLFTQELKKILVKFNVVQGDFNCNLNSLTSLSFAPKEVAGSFFASKNNLTSLKGAPIFVGEHFACTNNKLTSLKFCPQTVGGFFDCHDNQINTLEFCPQHVGEVFICYRNPALGGIQKKTDFKEIYQEHTNAQIRKEKNKLSQNILDFASDNQKNKFKI